MNLKQETKKPRKLIKQSANILELLLALAIASASMYPLIYIFRISQAPYIQSQTEYMATLLAHHVMESIIAHKKIFPEYLPDMGDPEPVVELANSVTPVSSFFTGLGDKLGNIRENDSSQLFWNLKQFNCHIDTYYLEGNVYKAIAYISYMKNGRNMRVFFERLLPQSEKTGKEE